ncbi:MAG: protein translocase subunit SecD [Clostridia bacterium]|nr:protein translocase subunit SecD [Clostridia bacterium]
MSQKLKAVLSILVIIVTVFGLFATFHGIVKDDEGNYINGKDALKYGLDINGGVYVVMEAQTDEMNLSPAELRELMEQTRAVIDNRVNELGVAESSVTIEGTNRLRVEMPGVSDADEAIEAIGTTAKLYFMLSDGTVVLDGSYVNDAQVDTDGSYYKILLEFDSEGASLFEEATRKAYNNEPEVTVEGMNSDEIAIVLDGTVLTHPQVRTVISGGKCEITGRFTQERATTLAALIRGGALPVELKEIQSSVQSATIGANALDKSIVAGGIGLIIIFALMILMYGLLGVIADIALMLYVAMFIWAMVGFNVVLTLPGIAALILSIGMAVDANVIIFSRIKEEICEGKSIRVAVDSGFKEALVTVLDAQITTLIAAIVLYEVGTTTVKGFALTLMIGIVFSIFTAVIISQLFLSFVAGTERFCKNKYFGVNEDGTPKQFINKKFNFIRNRKIFYIASCAIIIVGLVCSMIFGMNYGIDFTGGTTIQVEMGEQVKISDVEDAIKSFDLDPSIIYTGEGNTQIQIKTIKALENAERTEVFGALQEKFGLEDNALVASEQFGPSVGDELKANAIKAVLIAAVGMLIYIILRFKSWKYGLSAVVGVAHDVLMVLAFYAIFRYTVNNPFIAAILTLVGYSINDTIVIFDRIRYNKKIYAKNNNETNIDLSLNQTLNRTIMTSVTTLVVMVPLLFMVGGSIAQFIVPLMVGVIVGCYSSIFVCAPLYYDLNKKDEMSKYMLKQQERERADRRKEKAKEIEKVKETVIPSKGGEQAKPKNKSKAKSKKKSK